MIFHLATYLQVAPTFLTSYSAKLILLLHEKVNNNLASIPVNEPNRFFWRPKAFKQPSRVTVVAISV